CQQGNSNPLTF
nr:immunoglobulin light chain junction region [Macaca mulatta]MOV75245.1 immunoglobulin light chain junction region [Macaca mulatta]MOV76218.1 immunoglobulin light chain junction region [Macaca mulatta]MOV77691.1 immunoglobulin light chain junction region [Macaca mulatta]MOV77831.1 immunoglobulin light chain junction region [Macaca mulatta]